MLHCTAMLHVCLTVHMQYLVEGWCGLHAWTMFWLCSWICANAKAISPMSCVLDIWWSAVFDLVCTCVLGCTGCLWPATCGNGGTIRSARSCSQRRWADERKGNRLALPKPSTLFCCWLAVKEKSQLRMQHLMLVCLQSTAPPWRIVIAMLATLSLWEDYPGCGVGISSAS